jgi:hypothetical protein
MFQITQNNTRFCWVPQKELPRSVDNTCQYNYSCINVWDEAYQCQKTGNYNRTIKIVIDIVHCICIVLQDSRHPGRYSNQTPTEATSEGLRRGRTFPFKSILDQWFIATHLKIILIQTLNRASTLPGGGRGTCGIEVLDSLVKQLISLSAYGVRYCG